MPALPIGPAITRATTAIGERVLEVRTESGLGGTQLQVMRLGLDGISMNEIAERLHSPKSTITSVVDLLVAGGLVEREQDPSDRRRQIVTTSVEGRVIIARFDAVLAVRVGQLIDTLPLERKARLAELFANARELGPRSLLGQRVGQLLEPTAFAEGFLLERAQFWHEGRAAQLARALQAQPCGVRLIARELLARGVPQPGYARSSSRFGPVRKLEQLRRSFLVTTLLGQQASPQAQAAVGRARATRGLELTQTFFDPTRTHEHTRERRTASSAIQRWSSEINTDGAAV